MVSSKWNEEIQKLDELIALLESAPSSPESVIAEEHIQSARSCAWGAMPDEYAADLKFAQTAISHISDRATRQSAEKILAGLPTNRLPSPA